VLRGHSTMVHIRNVVIETAGEAQDKTEMDRLRCA
jgi:hypothetical protein